MITYDSSSHIYFLFESVSDSKIEFGMKFNLKGLKMQNTQEDNVWRFSLAAGEK